MALTKKGRVPLKSREPSQIRIYFDPQILSLEVDQYVWIYSPLTHEFLKIKKDTHAFLNLIEYIIRAKGIITLNELQNYLRHKNLDLDHAKIVRMINKLCEMERVFYLKKSQFHSSVNEIKRMGDNISSTNLRQAYLHITHRCNFNCWYCYNHKITKRKENELTVRKWQEAIGKLIERGAQDFIFTGGEPLLRSQDLYEIVKEVRNTHVKFTLLTNGSLFNEEIFNKLSPFIDHFIIISLDSFSLSTQKKNRSGNGFNNILKALEMFSKYAPQKLTVRSVVTQTNLNEIQETRKNLLEKFGITQYETDIFLPNSPEEVKLVPQLRMDVNIDDTFPVRLRRFAVIKYKCGACVQIIALDCQGDIYPCQSFIEEKSFKLGNIFETDWYNKLLSSPIRNLFWSLSVDDIEICKECSLRYLCGGGCPAISWRIYKNLNHHLSFLCEHLKCVAKKRLVNAATQKVRVLI